MQTEDKLTRKVVWKEKYVWAIFWDWGVINSKSGSMVAVLQITPRDILLGEKQSTQQNKNSC